MCRTHGPIELLQRSQVPGEERHESVPRPLLVNASRRSSRAGFRLPLGPAYPEPVRRDVEFVVVSLFRRPLPSVRLWSGRAGRRLGLHRVGRLRRYHLARAEYLRQNCNKPELYRAGPINLFQFNVGIDQITDGSSTTVLIAELAGRPDLWIRGVKQPAGAIKTEVGIGWNWGGCWACVDSAFQSFGGTSFSGGGMTLAQFEAGTPVCFLNCINTWSLNWYSFHPGAVGIALCDGSARMISENTGLTVLCRLQTYKGHARVSDASF